MVEIRENDEVKLRYVGTIFKNCLGHYVEVFQLYPAYESAVILEVLFQIYPKHVPIFLLELEFKSGKLMSHIVKIKTEDEVSEMHVMKDVGAVQDALKLLVKAGRLSQEEADLINNF